MKTYLAIIMLSCILMFSQGCAGLVIAGASAVAGGTGLYYYIAGDKDKSEALDELSDSLDKLSKE